MYFLYCGLCIIATVVVYLFIPETKRIPIEEIGVLFGDEVVVHLSSDGHNIVENEADIEKYVQDGVDGEKSFGTRTETKGV